MDRLEKYRNAIKKVLTEYHEWVSGSANLDQESCLVFDEIHDQYFWLFMGWEGKKKIRNIQVHIRIKNEKIYIEEDWTEEGIATELWFFVTWYGSIGGINRLNPYLARDLID